MKRLWRAVGIATLVAILGVAALGAVAFAQDDGGFPFDFHGRFREAVASALGVSVEEYDAAVSQAQDQVVDEAVTEGWLTEEQAELFKWRMDQAPRAGLRGMGKGLRGIGPHLHGGPDSLVSIAADELGMSLTDLLTELQAGKSIADVAAEQGVDAQAIADPYLAQLKENLDESVVEGKITQKQADYALEQAGERVKDQLNRTWEDGMRRFPGGGRPGRMWGFPGQSDA
jgi:hypothetical protein